MTKMSEKNEFGALFEEKESWFHKDSRKRKSFLWRQYWKIERYLPLKVRRWID